MRRTAVRQKYVNFSEQPAAYIFTEENKGDNLLKDAGAFLSHYAAQRLAWQFFQITLCSGFAKNCPQWAVSHCGTTVGDWQNSESSCTYVDTKTFLILMLQQTLELAQTCLQTWTYTSYLVCKATRQFSRRVCTVSSQWLLAHYLLVIIRIRDNNKLVRLHNVYLQCHTNVKSVN